MTYQQVSYSQLINSIPRWSTERIREIIAFLKLELKLRESYEKNQKNQKDSDEEC